MKRLAFSLAIVFAALFSNACEQHKAEALPPHYQHKAGGGHAEGGHDKSEPAGTHETAPHDAGGKPAGEHK
jgi:hypothetical protein